MGDEPLLGAYADKSHRAPFGILPSAEGCGLFYVCLRHDGWELDVQVSWELPVPSAPGSIHPTPTKTLQYRSPQAAERQRGLGGGTILRG